MSGKGRSGRFEPLGQVLQRIMKGRLGKRLASYDACEVWPRAAGPEIAKRCVALGIKSGILYVGVPDNVWLTELGALRERLIQSINEKLGKGVVKGIRFQIGVPKTRSFKRKR
jgi:predicted nucleic acid-binding Zn ribbon protein